MDNIEYKRCPFCSEMIRFLAIKCKHCDSLLDEESVAKIERVRNELIRTEKTLESESQIVIEIEPDIDASIITGNAYSLPQKPITEELRNLEWASGYFSGHLSEGVPHGRGEITLINGYKYVGEWVGGKKNGEGVLLLPSSEQYLINWRNDKLDDKFEISQIGIKSSFNESGNAIGVVVDKKSTGSFNSMTDENLAITKLQDDEDAKGYFIEERKKCLENETVDCPSCLNKIYSYSIKCKHCGKRINE